VTVPIPLGFSEERYTRLMSNARRITRDEILERVRTEMVALFELEPNQIQLETRVVEDLDLDSIDAIELGVQMEELTGRRFDPESFRQMRTVGDVVDIVQRILDEAPVSEAS
jgi:acyl carrier protein